MTDYQHLRELAEQATPGPWHLDSIETGEHALFVYHDRHDGYASHLVADRLTKADAEYLRAVPPETVLDLLDEIEQLRRGQGRAPAPAAAGPVPVALHEAHPIPDSTRRAP